jgi:predicted nucleic acid-binding protein
VSKFEKTIVAESILKEIKDSGGRFLKQVELGWIEVGDVMARKKISHAFRNLRSSSTSASLSTFKRRTASLVLTGSGGVEL